LKTLYQLNDLLPPAKNQFDIIIIIIMSSSIPQLAPGQVRKRNVFDIIEKFGDTTGKNILIRVDFNVPMNAEFAITDDSRIRGALPTIAAVLKAKHNCILMSHMGRPKAVQKGEDADGSERASLSLKHVVDRLSDLSGTKVQFVEDCVGDKVKESVSALPSQGGSILLLENLRFYPQEEKNDPAFAQSLASIADAYVNDAFGTCHRAHASVSGVPALLAKENCGVGCLVASEVAYLDFTGLGPDDKVAAGE
jgi:phosphoglycerate kinase